MARLRGIAAGAASATLLVAAGLGLDAVRTNAPPRTDLIGRLAGDDGIRPFAEGEASKGRAPASPTIDVVRIDADGAAVVAGSAGGPGRVTLRVDGAAVAVGDAAADGSFAAFFDLKETGAPRILTAEVAGADGAVVEAPDGIVVAPRAVPAVATAPAGDRAASAGRAGGEPPATGGVADATAASLRADPPPAEGPARPPRLFRAGSDGIARVAPEGGTADVLALDAIAYDDDGVVELTGTAPAGGRLRVALDGRAVREIAVGDDGVWSAPLPGVDVGIYRLTIDAVGPDGAVTSRVETPFERIARDRAAAPAGGGAQAITVQPGYTLWAIAEAHLGDGVRYVQIHEANRDAIRDADLIYPGQVFTLPDGSSAPLANEGPAD